MNGKKMNFKSSETGLKGLKDFAALLISRPNFSYCVFNF